MSRDEIPIYFFFLLLFRSVSSESSSRSPSPGVKGFVDGFPTPPRSRSNSPVKIDVCEKSRSLSPDRSTIRENNDNYRDVNENQLTSYKSLTDLEIKLTNNNNNNNTDYHSTFNSHKGLTMERNLMKTVIFTCFLFSF